MIPSPTTKEVAKPPASKKTTRMKAGTKLAPPNKAAPAMAEKGKLANKKVAVVVSKLPKKKVAAVVAENGKSPNKEVAMLTPCSGGKDDKEQVVLPYNAKKHLEDKREKHWFL
nr:unnamed protein product [Digitaria exilis]